LLQRASIKPNGIDASLTATDPEETDDIYKPYVRSIGLKRSVAKQLTFIWNRLNTKPAAAPKFGL